MVGDNSRVSPLKSESAGIPGLLRKISGELSIDPIRQGRYNDRRFFVICMTPRSGSTYLGSVLSANGIANVQEHFRIQGGAIERDAEKLNQKTYETYFRHKVEQLTSKSGYFGLKCDWPQYAPIYVSGLHAHYLRDAEFFYLTRSDILAQAISRYVATESNYFHSVNELPEGGKIEVDFDYDKIRSHLEHLIKMQSDWEQFFACEGLKVNRITYEELAKDPAKTVRDISSILGYSVDDVVVETEFKVVSTDLNDRLREQFVAEHRQRVAQFSWMK